MCSQEKRGVGRSQPPELWGQQTARNSGEGAFSAPGFFPPSLSNFCPLQCPRGATPGIAARENHCRNPHLLLLSQFCPEALLWSTWIWGSMDLLSPVQVDKCWPCMCPNISLMEGAYSAYRGLNQWGWQKKFPFKPLQDPVQEPSPLLGRGLCPSHWALAQGCRFCSALRYSPKAAVCHALSCSLKVVTEVNNCSSGDLRLGVWFFVNIMEFAEIPGFSSASGSAEAIPGCLMNKTCQWRSMSFSAYGRQLFHLHMLCTGATPCSTQWVYFFFHFPDLLLFFSGTEKQKKTLVIYLWARAHPTLN